MTILAHSPPDDVVVLFEAFGKWVKKSSPEKGLASYPLFNFTDSTACLNVAQAADLIHGGLNAGYVNDLVQILGLSKKEELGSALNTNGTSLWRWAKENKPLPGPTLEQIIRAMNLQFFAAEVFGTVELGRQWLRKPHPSLAGIAPMDYADNEFGAQKIRGMLAGLRYGGPV